MKKILFTCLVVCALINSSIAQEKLDKFGSSIEKKVGPKTIRVPYTYVFSYLGYAKKGTEEAVIDGKKCYFVYVWIPLVATELGARMISPAKSVKLPSGAVASEAYTANAASDSYFDTWIALERSNIVSVADLTPEKIKSATWTRFENNDDSGELPAQPSGSKYNSQLRYLSDTSNPLKSIAVGLYRIVFTTYKVGDVEGTFLAEVGSPIELPGMAVGTIDELMKQVKK